MVIFVIAMQITGRLTYTLLYSINTIVGVVVISTHVPYRNMTQAKEIL